MLRFSVFAACLMTATSAFAGDSYSPEKIANHIFKSVDQNGDGEMTREEHDAAQLSRYGSTFEMFDINKNERVTYEEYLAVFLQHHTGVKGQKT